MEVCPVCGEQRRNSARFCTTCGHRFAADDMASPSAAPVTPPVTSGTQEVVEPVIPGWPSPASQAEPSPWAPRADDRGGWPAPAPEAQATDDPLEVTWADVAATAFGSQGQGQPGGEVVSREDATGEFGAVDELDEMVLPSNTEDIDLVRQRARSLMRELQEVIEDLTGDYSASADLVGQLEISLTTPAPLGGEALADLRSAAEAAQERPRDLDTLTGLTAQAETILALIVGYERATAGIERAIETLRSDARHTAG